MRWPQWLRRRGDSQVELAERAEQAKRDQEAKLREFRRNMVPETRQTLHSFTVAVEVAMRRRR